VSIECLQGLTNVSNESPLCFARIVIERCWVSHRSDIAYPGPYDIIWLCWHSLKQHLLSALMPSLGPKGQQLYSQRPTWMLSTAVSCAELRHGNSLPVPHGLFSLMCCLKWTLGKQDVPCSGSSWNMRINFIAECSVSCWPSLLVFSVLWASFGASKVIPPANTLGLGQKKKQYIVRTCL